MTKQTFNVKNLPVNYRLPNYTLVPLEEVESSNECRLYSEIFMAVGLTLMGVVIPQFNLTWFVTGGISLGLSIFFMIKYLRKNKKLNNVK